MVDSIVPKNNYEDERLIGVQYNVTVWQTLCVYLKNKTSSAKRAVHQKDSSHKYNGYSQTNYKLYSRYICLKCHIYILHVCFILHHFLLAV